MLVARWFALRRESVNWDEFALLHRAWLTASTGDVVGGGRPGLGTLLVAPFAEGCRNAVDAIVQARLLWSAMVAASALAFWLLLRGVLPRSPYRWLAATTGLGLWLLAPVFLRYSIQVRTDQPAVLMGLLGGLALLASRQTITWSVAAGILFGLGFLVTQKLLYVGGLIAVLALGQLLIERDWQTRRELLRAALTTAAFFAVIAGYRLLVVSPDSNVAMLPLGSASNVFDYYRQEYGWRLYQALVPQLMPQMAGLLLVIAGSAAWFLHRGRHGAELLTAWLVVIVGMVVLLFHAARFPYFYIVLGLFPAAVGALAIGPVLERLETPLLRRLLITVIWVPLLIQAGRQTQSLVLIDSQGVQREALSFVDRNFASDARGYHPHGLFVCREGRGTFPVRFRQHVVAEFGGDLGSERALAFLDEFRSRPVQYLILPTSEYTPEISTFWATRYVQYAGAVHVPGRHVRGPTGATSTWEVVVPGEYIWRPRDDQNVPVEVAGQLLRPGDTITLPSQGVVPIALPEGGVGMMVLALDEPPSDPRSFYTGW